MMFTNKVKKYLKEIITTLLMVIILANIISYYKSTNLNKNNLQLTSVTLLDNTKYTIPTNKPLLIHFWATWCPICKIEASNIERLSKKFEVITIAVDSKSRAKLHFYLQKHHLTFHVIDDFDKHYASLFKISVYPTTFIYDKNHNLVFSDVGYSSTLGLYLRMLWASF